MPTALRCADLASLIVALALSECGGGGGTDPAAGGGTGGAGGAGGDTMPPVAPPPTNVAVFPSRTPTVTAVQPVTLSTYPSSEMPLTYQWQRNVVNIPGATHTSYTHIAQLEVSGSEFRLGVSNAGGSAVSPAVTLTVLPVRADTANLFAGAIGGPGDLNGVGAAAHFAVPYGLAVDRVGNVIVADGKLRRVTPDGVVSALGTAPFASTADAVALDAGGNLFVMTDYFSYPGSGGAYKMGVDGFFTNLGCISNPTAFALDLSGSPIVADLNGSAIRKAVPGGGFTVIAGGGSSRSKAIGSQDGVGADAQFNNPRSLAVDPAGNVYLADTVNQIVRMIAPDGLVRTMAGTTGAQGITIDALPAG